VGSAASSSRAFTFSTSFRRLSIASKRVRYPLTSRAMMSKSVNSVPRNADRLYPVDPARAGPAVKLRRLELLASRASRVGGLRALGRDRMQGQVRTSYAVWGRERLSRLPDPQPLAELCDETFHRASLRRLANRKCQTLLGSSRPARGLSASDEMQGTRVGVAKEVPSSSEERMGRWRSRWSLTSCGS